MKCKFCGHEVSESALFCNRCGFPVGEEQAPVSTVERPSGPQTGGQPAAEARQSIQVNRENLILAEGEEIIKQYHCSDVKGARGFLTVTNKRLMFHAIGVDSRLSQEITLDSVTGVSSYYGTNYRYGRIAVGSVLILLCILFVAIAGNSFIPGFFYTVGFALGALGVLLIALSIRKSFLIAFYSKDVSLSPIVVGEGPSSLLGNDALLALQTERTQETDMMLNEIGALIQDMQTLGDHALEKWKHSTTPQNMPTL